MTFRAIVPAVALATLALSAPAAAGDAPGPGSAAILDEYNVDVYGGSDSSRVALGLSFGDVAPSGWWWAYGGRLSWAHYADKGPVIDGWGLGGTLTGGWRPDRVVSPVVGLSAEKTFGTGGKIDAQAHLHAGARIRVTPDPGEYLAITFAVFGSKHFFGNGLSDQSDVGIAVLFSTARFAGR